VGRPLWREDGSLFCICYCPCQRSLSQVRVPWYSRPYFTVSELRLPFSSPPTTRRVTVEVFVPASTRVSELLSLSLMLRPTVSRPVCLGIKHPSGACDQTFKSARNTSGSYVLHSVGRPLWREDGSVFCMCRWSLPAQSFSGPSPLGLATVFYCLRFETSLFVASYDSQGHGGGIRPRLHTGDWLLTWNSALYNLGADTTENALRTHIYWFVTQQKMLLYCWDRNFWNVCTEPLPSNYMRHTVFIRFWLWIQSCRRWIRSTLSE
jgi:hypothetical protein